MYNSSELQHTPQPPQMASFLHSMQFVCTVLIFTWVPLLPCPFLEAAAANVYPWGGSAPPHPHVLTCSPVAWSSHWHPATSEFPVCIRQSLREHRTAKCKFLCKSHKIIYIKCCFISKMGLLTKSSACCLTIWLRAPTKLRSSYRSTSLKSGSYLLGSCFFFCKQHSSCQYLFYL